MRLTWGMKRKTQPHTQVERLPPRGTPGTLRKQWRNDVAAKQGPWGCQPLRLELVGPKKQNQASVYRCGPSGSSTR
ncbi:hypothetical protein PUN28_017933 [Cardiocondyla obscurior]|uniref:Uncharacterized protein n=1 Tax=Cardiocondyla obscurior TaxID=286306 RepID=A0AAW2EJJ7_9HYME